MFPRLTKEEFEFFKYKEKKFFKKFDLQNKVSLRRRIAVSLHSLAVAKLGYHRNDFETKKGINKKEAIGHFLKMYEYWPETPEFALFRKEAGIVS
jgi:hypothetical protein